MKLRRSILCLLLSAVLLLGFGGAAAYAEPVTFNLTVQVGEKTQTVRALQND